MIIIVIIIIAFKMGQQLDGMNIAELERILGTGGIRIVLLLSASVKHTQIFVKDDRRCRQHE